MDNSIIPIIKELERIYDALAIEFKLKHPRPLITIQSKGRQKVLGWHWEDKWERGKQTISEINICAEELNNNPIETLVHEMVHYSNTCDKIEDCNSQQYHNGLKGLIMGSRRTHLTITAPTKMKRYSCGCTTIRCATILEAKCLRCNNEFKEQE